MCGRLCIQNMAFHVEWSLPNFPNLSNLPYLPYLINNLRILFTMDACAIITGNYLADVRTLVSSYRRNNPEGRFFVLFLDDIPSGVNISRESFVPITTEELGIENLEPLAMQYSPYELSMALRPDFLLFLQEQRGTEKIVFLDSDLYFTGSLDHTDTLLDSHAIVLTPSFTKPIPEDGCFPSDRDFLAAGIFNGGFFACRSCAETTGVLTWLSTRLKKYAFYRPEESMFGDQKWLDMLPAIAPTLHVLRHPGYNVSHWNLHERSVTENDGMYLVNGDPLVFYHFSGFDPRHDTTLSRHQNRFSFQDVPALTTLYAAYRRELLEHGYDTFRAMPYRYGAFANGVRISPVIRRIYEAAKGPERFPKPFDGQFLEWLQTGITHLWKTLHIMNVHLEIWRLSVEAQSAFPQPATKDLSGFCRWMLRDRAHELDLDPAFTHGLTRYVDDSLPREAGWQLLLRRRHTNETYQKFCRLVKAIIGRKIYDRLKPRRDPMVTLRFRSGLKKNSLPREGVNLFSSLSGETGIAEGGRGFAAALRESGVAVMHVDTRTTPGRQAANEHPLTHDASFDTSLVVGGFDEIAMTPIPDSPHVVAYVPWELSKLPLTYATLLAGYDEVWTPSSFSVSAIGRALSIPAIRMPHAVDVFGASQKKRSDFGIPEEATIFLFVFDFHSRIERKNPVGLITSFVQSFGPRKDAFLIISATHGKDFPEEFQRLENSIRSHPNIRLLTDYLPRADLLALMTSADCYVSLHRSEGFGLTIAEAMALGIPVIATDYGGSTDFLTGTTGYPVPYSLRALESEIGPYPAGAIWAEPDLSEAAAIMQHVCENRDEAKRKALLARRLMENDYSPRVIGERMKERLTLLRRTR